LGFFFLIFALVALWELLAPRRGLTTSKKVRWVRNLGITFMNPFLVRLLFPILAVNMAVKAQERGWGLLNNFDLPYWLDIVVGIMVLDLVIYLQHVMFHAIPILWRLHMVHHSVIIRETNSNYGFNLPWWDRLFGTYCHQPAKGHAGMTIGLTQFRDPAKLTLPWLLILPFIGNPGRYPINRH
jgi:sterol desaturase/sphingolipid hydroxylase (fatty acid hydroxylase superfamily)